jgi:hypothetical protein
MATTSRGPAIAEFLRRLEAGYREFRDVDAERDFGSAWAEFWGAGFLRRAHPRTAVPCPECEADALPVTFLDQAGGARSKPSVNCPRCGLTPVAVAALRQSRLDIGRLVAAIGRAAGAADGAAAQLAPHLWHLGRLPSAVRSKDAYLTTRTGPEDHAAKNAVLARRPKAILFLPTRRAMAMWVSGPPEVVLSLDSFVSFAGGRLVFDAPAFGSAVQEAGSAPRRRPAGRGGIRLKQIRDITGAVREHIRDARDSAYRDVDSGRDPKLLPRPTQAEFGARVGLDTSQTSRCFNHEAAGELWDLFELAADLYRVMARPP